MMEKKLDEISTDDHPYPGFDIKLGFGSSKISNVDVVAGEMADYMQQPQISFADVMQFATYSSGDGDQKLGLHISQTKINITGPENNEDEEEYLREFAKMNAGDHSVDVEEEEEGATPLNDGGGGENERINNNNNNNLIINNNEINDRITGVLRPRKRRRTMKTIEEAESQRMTHIAVERNRRKQMNEHLRVLRSLMPTSYVQRGDQASIIGGAIEFVRELEQLLQCLESQKRRRMFGSDVPSSSASVSTLPLHQHPPSTASDFIIPAGPTSSASSGEDVSEKKTTMGDVESRVLGFDASIKVLSRRRPGQLLKMMELIEETMELAILHTNITTIEQTVLYSFNTKIPMQRNYSAKEIVDSVQQILAFIEAST